MTTLTLRRPSQKVIAQDQHYNSLVFMCRISKVYKVFADINQPLHFNDSLSPRFTADVRSVLSRNLHQHRLWWSAESRGGAACCPASSSLPASFLPSIPSQMTHQPSQSPSDVSWGDEGWGDRLTRDEQYGITRAQKLLRREGEPPFVFLFFLDSLFVFFFSKTKWSLSALSLLILTVCVWRRADVCESEYACWVH